MEKLSDLPKVAVRGTSVLQTPGLVRHSTLQRWAAEPGGRLRALRPSQLVTRQVALPLPASSLSLGRQGR